MSSTEKPKTKQVGCIILFPLYSIRTFVFIVMFESFGMRSAVTKNKDRDYMPIVKLYMIFVLFQNGFNALMKSTFYGDKPVRSTLKC